MPQRKAYHHTKRRAILRVWTGQVVNSRQTMGSLPAGAPTSWASTAQSWRAGQLFFNATAGGRTSTVSQRNSKVASRAGWSLRRGTFTNIVPPNGAAATLSQSSVPSVNRP